MFRYCNYWNNIILLEEINPDVNYMSLGFDWMVFFFVTSWFCKINASKVSVIIKLLLGCQKQCISFANLYMHSLLIKIHKCWIYHIILYINFPRYLTQNLHKICPVYKSLMQYIFICLPFIFMSIHNKLLVFSSIDTCMCLVFAWSCLFFLFDNILTHKKIIYWF